MGADAITTIPKGGEMTLVSFDGDFALVEYQDERGYVPVSYTHLTRPALWPKQKIGGKHKFFIDKVG